MILHTSPQKDRFIHNRLPPSGQWPVITPLDTVPLTGPLNCVEHLLDRHIRAGSADKSALHGGDRIWTYGGLSDRVNQIAHVLVENYNIEPGNRVLIRGENGLEAVAIWLAVLKIGAIAVTTMSLLRAGELKVMAEIARPALAVCQESLIAELEMAAAQVEYKLPVLNYGDECGALYDAMADKPVSFQACPTLADDISIVAFTSGTTGKPKATVHFHRDVLAICETVCAHILRPVREDVFIGTAPLAFTFGLGGLLIFPLYTGASAVLHGRYSPQDFAAAIDRYKATVCFTVPSYYQQIVRLQKPELLSSLRMAVSSGEALPDPVREAWAHATGLQLTEVLGSTEMLHAFAGSTGANVRPGFIGPAIKGYEIAILDGNGDKVRPGEIGNFAVRGPTGCRYLCDPRQENYVQHGWNLTGDACAMTEDGYVSYHTRYDDMIISSGYNISGLEVENVLLEHPAIAECAVIGEPDDERGHVVAAYVVAKNVASDQQALARQLQDYVKSIIAPYKYPRRVVFIDRLPRNESGKIQRFRLRQKDDVRSAFSTDVSTVSPEEGASQKKNL